ncbi:MAG: tRNA lysidine(34) synthetase TilS [Bacteroidales bacterium]
MSLIKRFEQYLRNVCHVSPTDNILVAVSGGPDSMCLLHLLHTLRQPIAIVHCNFQLRGSESDEDEAFVSQLAEQESIPIFVKKFDTLAYAQKHGLTIQEAARELRYSYFENIRQLHGFIYIATAHQADDSIETFFVNLIRGTGLKGLTGIKPIHGKIIRPLLFAFRNEIEQYCAENNISFRTDSSNLTDKYLRNQIRHHVIPALERLNPAFRNTMLRNIANIQQATKIYQHYIDHEIKKLPQHLPDGVMAIAIEKIKKQPSPPLALLELLLPLRFTPDTCADIFRVLEAEPGKEFFSPTHRLIKDREFLLIETLENKDIPQLYYIESYTQQLTSPIRLSFQMFESSTYRIKSEKHIAALDADKLVFPLLLRRWNKGDYFIPLGMKHFKKISDFFIDLKLSRIQKERIWILANGEEIVWVIGLRIDERYKISSNTKHILEIRWEE